jgi:hypothetical protein
VIDWDTYRDALGFLSGKPRRPDPESNAVLFSAEERMLRLKLGTWGEFEQRRLSDAISIYLIQKNQLVRPPNWRQDKEGPDNHIGLGACGGPLLALSVLGYLERDWTYLAGFYLRFPAIVAHLTWAAGGKPTLWRRLYWAVSVALSGSGTNQDAWIQSWLMLETAPPLGLERLAAAVYWYRLKREWISLGVVFMAYFGNSEHPCAVACRELGL